MILKFSKWIDQLSEFFAARKGLLPILGILLVIINFVLQLTTNGWLAGSGLFLHLGIVVAIIGMMIAWAL